MKVWRLLKAYLSLVFFIKPFIVTMTDEHREHVLVFTM